MACKRLFEVLQGLLITNLLKLQLDKVTGAGRSATNKDGNDSLDNSNAKVLLSYLAVLCIANHIYGPVLLLTQVKVVSDYAWMASW